LFRRHVAGGAEQHARLRPIFALLEILGQAKVADLCQAVFGEQDVRRLQVAVYDALLMGVIERPGQSFDQFSNLSGRQ
jgi:hypothetical protein